MSDSKLKLLAGLGNPGREYSQTRHNIGFLVVDALASSLSLDLNKSRFDADYTKARIKGRDTFLVKPMSYMNRSGQPLQRFASYFKIDLDSLVVVHDDMDLDFGKIKIVQGRGHGGHNGIRSIISAFGGNGCVRIRVGVGHPGHQKGVTGHVLGKFSPEEQDGLEPLIGRAVDACLSVLEKGPVKAMNLINTRR